MDEWMDFYIDRWMDFYINRWMDFIDIEIDVKDGCYWQVDAIDRYEPR